MGGYAGGHLSDIVLVNFENKSSRVVMRKSFLNFSCQSNAVMVDDGSVVSLVTDEKQILHILSYKGHEGQLSIIETLGHI